MPVLVRTTRYASKHKDNRATVQLLKKKKSRPNACSPIYSPSVLLEKICTSSLESIIGAQVFDRHWDSRDRINASLFYILNDANTVEAGTRRSDDGVMHDFECNPVDQMVRNHLEEKKKQHISNGGKIIINRTGSAYPLLNLSLRCDLKGLSQVMYLLH